MVGFGNIAKRLCHLLTGFDVTISAFDKHFDKSHAYFYNVQEKLLEHIFVESDVVVILLPYYSELDKFIDRRLLSLMHYSSLIIIAAR
ncbi:NAD(P)-dependent oxidoreductase [Huaxiibacter chinensis]|uniref:NAD(P)-dependent oxidoreductase n=1 Tax=Huaxiibacter chinensis TaxID=2899785 RepID=UPI003D30EFD4